MFSDFTWWHVVYLLVTTHITIVTVTVYLHRGLAHRALTFSKPLEHFFRFWSWFSTGQNPKEWASVHRKHHSFCEKEGDPHSPKLYGIWNVLFKGVMMYQKEAKNEDTIKRFGHMTPDDNLHHKFYAKYTWLGLVMYALINLALFGWHGIWLFTIQALWIPFWAAGVINGVGHFWGYRNFNTTDASTNISPWGIIIGGEELHNNHHAYATSAKLSFKWYEFDIGWGWIKLFEFFGLLSINKVAHLPQIKENQDSFCLDTILANKSYVLRMFYKKTKAQVVDTIRAVKESNPLLKSHSNKELNFVFYHDKASSTPLTDGQQVLLSEMLKNKVLSYIYQAKEDLLNFWNNKTANTQQMKEQIVLWIESVKKTSKENHTFKCLDVFASNLIKLKAA